MLAVLCALMQALNDQAETFDRRGARVPLQRVHAETGEAHDKVVWRRPRVSARQQSQQGVVDCLAAVLCVGVEEVVHQVGYPRYSRKSPVERSVHRLRRSRLDGLLETLPCEDLSP